MLYAPNTFIKIIEPGIEDGLVAHSVLAVHDEHRVGGKAVQHLKTNILLPKPTPWLQSRIKQTHLAIRVALLDHPKGPGDLGIPDITNISGNYNTIP